MFKKFASRKLFVFVGTGLAALLVQAGLPEEAATEVVKWLVGLGSAYILGQSGVDAVEAGKAPSE